MEWEVKSSHTKIFSWSLFGFLELSGVKAKDILGLFEVWLAARQAFWRRVGVCVSFYARMKQMLRLKEAIVLNLIFFLKR